MHMGAHVMLLSDGGRSAMQQFTVVGIFCYRPVFSCLHCSDFLIFCGMLS